MSIKFPKSTVNRPGVLRPAVFLRLPRPAFDRVGNARWMSRRAGRLLRPRRAGFIWFLGYVWACYCDAWTRGEEGTREGSER